jgi:hypothetical protein
MIAVRPTGHSRSVISHSKGFHTFPGGFFGNLSYCAESMAAGHCVDMQIRFQQKLFHKNLSFTH